MPYVLKKKENAQIFTMFMKNSYGLEYYGTPSWEDRKELEGNWTEILTQLGIREGQWELVEVDQSQVRLFNVKLNNDPRKRLYLDTGTGKSFTELS